jgi:hypothetical protein
MYHKLLRHFYFDKDSGKLKSPVLINILLVFFSIM